MRLHKTITLTLLACTSLLQAVGEESVPGYRASYPENAVGVSALCILPKTTRKGHFSFSDTNVLCNPRLWKDQEVETCLLAGVRDVRMSLRDHLQKKNTPYAVLGLNTTYLGVPRWTWIGGVSMQSAMRHFSFGSNTRYIATAVGRYALASNIGLTAGFYTELGFRASIVQPVVGFDYTRGKWTLEAVYPVKGGIVYSGFNRQLISAIVRPFYTALRNEKGLGHRPAISTFNGTGLELRYDFLPKRSFDLWMAIGRTFASTLTVGDRHNNHRHHINLHSAPYVNIGVMIAL
jgi:hypothetical protein